MKRITVLILAIVALIPASALAKDSSTCQAYNPQTCNVLSTEGNAASSTGAASSGSLPFTGLDVFLLLIGAGTLIGAGFVLRAVTRRME
jgi:hypothetical protein